MENGVRERCYRKERIMKLVVIEHIFIFLEILILCTVCGCRGNQGPTGPAGLAGRSPAVIVPDDIPDIQQAVDSLAQTGGTIYIKAGLYTLNHGIHIDSSNIALSGEEGTIIRLAANVNQPVILIGSDLESPARIVENIAIENLEIDGNKEYQNSETDPTRTWIRNNGIDIRMARNVRLNRLDVCNARSGGIVVSWDSRYIFIDQSSLYNNYFDGIALYASEFIQVSDFFCYDNGAAGLSLDDNLKNVSFSNGTIHGNGDVGIFARYSKDLMFSGLTISQNRSHGCFLSHQSAGTQTGVTRLFFSGCSFIENTGYGLWLASPSNDSPDNSVVGCLFSGNTSGAIQLDPNGILDQESNIFQ